MGFSLVHCFAHTVVTSAIALLACRWHARKGWPILVALLFFISPLAVFFIWGPYHFYWIYVLTVLLCVYAPKPLEQFYVFLKTQEAVIRYLFWAAVVIFCSAIVLMTRGEIDIRRDGFTFWKQEMRRHPSPEVMNNLADIYRDRKEFLKAKEFYAKAVAKDPRSFRAYEGLANLAKASGQWAVLLEVDQKILAIKPKCQEAYLGLGEAYRALGKTKEAVEAYSALLKSFPDDEGAYVKVIEAYGKAVEEAPRAIVYQEKREEVLADLEQLSKRKKYNAVDYYNLAFLYEQVGGKEEAVRFYAKAVQMQPNYAQALYNLANLYQDAGNYKAALAYYGRLVRVNSKFAPAYLNMGVIFNALGDHQRAKRLYLKAVDADPDNGSAYFNLGYLSESQGELRDAINDYEKAIEVDPKNPEPYYNLGNVYASLGQNGEAIALYLKTVGINPRHLNAYVNLSILSFKSGDFQGAIHYLEQARVLGYNPPAEYLKTLEPYRKK